MAGLVFASIRGLPAVALLYCVRFPYRGRRRIHSRLLVFPLFTRRETRRPIELLAFGMSSYQRVGTQLEKVAAIFESEFPNHPFEPFQVLKTNTGGPFWFLL
jgi:hypothetical protein